jgi:hypothetical protein
MLEKIDGLCAERDRLKAELPKPKGKVLGPQQRTGGSPLAELDQRS